MDRNTGSKAGAGLLGRLMPASPLGSAAGAAALTVLIGAGLVAAGTSGLRTYGWALFVGVPFVVGFLSSILYGYHAPRSFLECFGVTLLSLSLLALVLLLVKLEGLVCILMAAPIAVLVALPGTLVGFILQLRDAPGRSRGKFLGAVLLGLPFLMGAEHAARPEPPLREVRSSIEIDAPPERVWRHVVAFSELPPPDEWIFRTGLAYPLRAEIRGSGPGAVRRCVFSTGAFVEPIDTWDEPRLLAFSVIEQPAPMVETTPYGELKPPHLDGYFVSRRGQFRLEELPGGRTRLEGSTGYTNRMFPAPYWALWSDAIIHRIHLRVLRHVKDLSERKGP